MIDNSMITRLIFALIGLGISILGEEFLSQLVFDRESDQGNLVWVNEKPITLAQAEIGSMYLFGKTFDSIDQLERHSLTQVLIDEELLIQRGETLKIPNRDIGVRKSLVSASIRDITSKFDAVPVSERTLRSFFSEHQSIFEKPERMALDVIVLSKQADLRLAKSSIAAGRDLSEIAKILRLNFAIPRGLQTVPIIYRQLGTKIASFAEELETRQISPPIRGSGGVYFMQLTVTEDAVLPSFNDVRDTVKQEYRRRGRELALREKIDLLASEADIKTMIMSASHK
jgi:hypothetical protein